MNLSELEKIVNDGKAKLKAYDQADIALSQLKALSQYEKETRANLDAGLAELDKVKKSIEEWKAKETAAKSAAEEVADEAKNKAKSVMAEAEAQAQTILAKAVLDADKQKQEAAKAAGNLALSKEALELVKADLAKYSDELAAVKAKFAALAG